MVEAAKFDVSTVLLDRRPDASLEQLADHAHDLPIGLVIPDVVLLLGPCLAGRGRDILGGLHDEIARADDFGDEAEDFGFDMRPVRIRRLGDGDEIGAVEDGGDAVDAQQSRR